MIQTQPAETTQAMHADERPEPALDLWFARSETLADHDEPDESAWCEPEPFVDELAALEELDEDAGSSELEIPAAVVHALPTEAWNLGTESHSPMRRLLAAAAAFVPLMLTAEPVLAAEPPASPVAAPSEQPPPPQVASPAPAPSQASIWDALRDRQVVLSLADGSSFRGTVLSVTDGVLVCAREGDGLMVLLNTAQVTAVHVESLPEPPAKPRVQNGQGLIVFGSIATAIGGALSIASVAVAGSCASDSYYPGYLCPYYTIPLGVVGVVNLAVGIPLLATGVRKRAAARAAEQPAVSAFVLPGRNGVMGGVGVRF